MSNIPASLVIAIWTLFLAQPAISASATGQPYSHGVRAAYTGDQAKAYNSQITSLDTGLQFILQEDFATLKQALESSNPKLSQAQLDVTGSTPFDMHRDCKTNPVTITISKELRLTIFRIAQAGAALSILPESKVDKATAFDEYVSELSKFYVAREITKNKEAIHGRPPEINEFLGLTDAEAMAIANDPNYTAESANQWVSAMRVLLAHAMAHIALGHCDDASGNALIVRETEADDRALQFVETTWKDELNFSLLAGKFYLAYFHYRPDTPRELFQTLLTNFADNLKKSLNRTQNALRTSPDMSAVKQTQNAADMLMIKSTDIDALFADFKTALHE